MKPRAFARSRYWISPIVLLLLTLALVLSFTHTAIAQGSELRRDDIIRIAERYVSHTWNATAANILHDQRSYAGTSWQIDTPDAETPRGTSLGGWWTIGQNTSVPYQWGGWSALPDLDLRLIPDFGGDFNQQLASGFAAGDIYTNPDKPEYRNAAGVDCSGLVSRAWRTNSKLGTSGLRDTTRPLKFADLRPGDLLVTAGHAVLFKEFLTTEKATPGTTRILVIEASGNDWRVSEREYTLSALTEEPELWRGKEYTTDIVTLTRPGVTYPNYSPRTYLNPIDIVLVIDRSGSMGTDKMRAARDAAKLFVDLMRTGDKIGVVDFDHMVTVTYPLTEINQDGSVKTAAKNAIDTLYARGATSVGGGLQTGQNELNARGGSDHIKNMVLLSDGQENTPPFVDSILPGIINDKIVVHTVGLGSDADQALLDSIAIRTGGVYRYAPSARELWQIYNSILAKVYGRSVARTASGTVAQGGVAEETVFVDSSVGSATFAVFWPGSDLDLVLVQPDGTIIDPAVADTNPSISFVSGATYEFYEVDAPQHGEWRLRILGASTPPGGEQYTASVSVTDALFFTAASGKTPHFSGIPIRITASIEDSYLDVATPQYILGASMQVTAEDPARNLYTFDLFDDGQHGDGEADDGVYANTFSNTSLIGSYNFSIKVVGVNNRDSQPFTREYAFSLVVEEPLVPILDNFNRKNGRLGSAWRGQTSGYKIVDEQADVEGGGPIYWNLDTFGSDQGAFITLPKVDPKGQHQSVMLKMQGTSWRSGSIFVFYNAVTKKIGIETYVPNKGWTTLATFGATLHDGDQLSGRAEADGTVRAFVNGVEIGSANAGSFFVGKGGRVGLWFIVAADAVLDDFAGGTIAP